jgi:carboxymethylenebutenolidase
VPENDPAVTVQDVTFGGADGAMIMAYLARPVADGGYPAVLICHENRGTSEHYRDIARRYAKAGYVGLHLDLLSRQGGTAAVPPNQIGGIISGPGAAERHVSDFQAGMAYLREQPFVAGDQIGMTGYCFGGGVTWNVATKEPTLRAAAPYYGAPAFPGEVGNIRAAILAVYAQLDERTTQSGLAVEPALAAAHVSYKYNVYPGAMHAFFNDTGGAYNETAALAAWQDTLAWFSTYLSDNASPPTGDEHGAEAPGAPAMD